MSNSYSNLLDLATGDFRSMRLRNKRFPGPNTPPSAHISVLEEIEEACTVSSDDPSSSLSQCRIIMVVNELPISARRDSDGRGWVFAWEEDSLFFQLRDGLPDDIEVLYVGSLKADVDGDDVNEQDTVSRILLDRFKCVPTFIPTQLLHRFYHKFCKKQLWPVLHYLLPFSAEYEGRFDRSLWEDYVQVNKLFSEKVVELINPDDDYVWVHGYHLMAMPSFLRRRFNQLRMGFFLHSPFPCFEVYRTFPVRDEIMRALLNADLIGFHTFDYAWHFLSCCTRMLGLQYHLSAGNLVVPYYGRTVWVKILPVGVHMGRIEKAMKLAARDQRMAELRAQFEGKTVLLGVDDMDFFKGIDLKLLAMEQMLKQRTDWQGKAVLVQIVRPARSGGTHVAKAQSAAERIRKRINDEFGKPGYEPVVYIHRSVSLAERIAYYAIAECVVVTAVRDGMNLTPYEYVVCRHGLTDPDSRSLDLAGPKKSMLVVPELAGCSLSLSGAIRVNPWDIEATAVAMGDAISMVESEKRMRHGNHFRYVSSHDVTYWARSFWQDLVRNCSDHFKRKTWGTGLGFGFRVISLDPDFRKLSTGDISSAYQRSRSRAILLDYDGTLMPQNSAGKTPSQEVISIVNALCADSRNTVFVVSGRGRKSLSEWFSHCRMLGVAAEDGYFVRWPEKDEWETWGKSCSSVPLQIAETIMQLYTEATDGSYMESKESALVWHHHDADPDFGSAQAKELADHLESVLGNDPVAVRKGKFMVEVKPQCVSKGLVAEKVFTSMAERGKQADFVLCIGDEDMFARVEDSLSRNILANGAMVFACTVGQKPSKARYFVNDSTEVKGMLESLLSHD